MKNLVMSLLAACLPISSSLAEDKPDNQDIQKEMPKVYRSLIEIYGLAAKTEGFNDKAQQAKIEQNLKALVSASSRVQEHTKQRKSALRFTGEFLANDARRAYEYYQRGQYEESQFFVRSLVDNCIACHSSLPTQQSSNFATDVFKTVQSNHFSEHEKARLLVATRQFDEALRAYEQMLNNQNLTEISVISLDPFLEYLNLCIRVKTDLIRPKKLLLNLLDSPALPAIVRQDISSWVQSLTILSGPPELKKTSFEIARDLINKARSKMEFPTDRTGVVFFLRASSLLQEFLEEDPRKPEVLAESYYLLGTAELLVGRSYWLSHADNYLEAAVRSAPTTVFAQRAFALLEENARLEYGTGPTNGLPPEVRERLESLRSLVQNAPQPKKKK